MARQLNDPPPSPALPAEGRESEGHAIGFLLTTNERRYPFSTAHVSWADHKTERARSPSIGDLARVIECGAQFVVLPKVW